MNGSPTRTPRIVLTPGEPAGIGPDLCVLLAQDHPPCDIAVVADPALLGERANQLGLPLQIRELKDHEQSGPSAAGCLDVIPVPLKNTTVAGCLDPNNAPYVLATLERAVTGCLSGEFDAMVTGPVQKSVINAAGIPFSGHTEWLAQRTGAPLPVMMLTCPGLRVALVTTHLPLKDVPKAITPERLRTTVEILHRELQSKYHLDQPRILVCGLNPHAGEDGHLGDEEIRVIRPVIQQLAAEGLNVFGPMPADTAFTPPQLEKCDVVLAMYHDQGLTVLKHKGFGDAVNVTLGLPLIRTSVDHGTALDLAGTGGIDPGSLRAAVAEAVRCAQGRLPA